MKKYQLLSTTVIILLLTALFPITASANSSWHWISHTNPVDVFPIIVILTLAIETVFIKKIAKPENIKWGKLFSIITFANLLSFFAPYAIKFIIWIEEKWYLDSYTFFEWLMKLPFYTTGIIFLIITLLIEVPVVFLVLRKRVVNRKVLLCTTIGINIISTIIVAIVERLLCFGSW